MSALRNFLSLSFLLALAVSSMFGQNVGNCTAKDSSTRPDCPGAIAFFEKLQVSVKADKHTDDSISGHHFRSRQTSGIAQSRCVPESL